MSALPTPAPLFNPITSPNPLLPGELYAGPFGLIAFAPLIPLILLAARRWRRPALIVGSLIWLVPTLRPASTVVLLAGVAAGCAWLLALAALRRRGLIGRGLMTALVWLGLHALVLPLWWQSHPSWYPSRLAVLHNAGFAYFLLRLLAWGTQLARDPHSPVRLLDTVCWLLYPPCMRLGPVLLREAFLRRLDTWCPRQSPDWKAGASRLGMFALGGLGIAVVVPQILPSRGDYFASPASYTTAELIRFFYLVPVYVYLLLWTYNQLAVGLSAWLGIRVDDNFHRLPLATSVRDFWRRWHITVGGWLREYIYIPLGGSRRRTTVNILLVFAWCGVWHGPSWSFLAWGLSQAVALNVQRFWDWLWGRQAAAGEGPARGPLPGPRRLRDRLWTVVCWLLTIHYQSATIVVFVDFEHLGWRLLCEIAGRLLDAAR